MNDGTPCPPDSATSPPFGDQSPTCRRQLAEYSPTGLPLFDSARAAQARDAAITAVERNADPDVRDVILQAIAATARELPTLTTDDVWLRVPQVVRLAVEPRVMGALMREAARRGVIEPMPGIFLASDMVRCHRRPKQVWRSKTQRAK
ncbi:MAG: hypothetical protein ACYC3X_25485 [Pirellulaceae bacterium]